MLPIMIVFASGYILQRNMHLDLKSISSLALYVFIPCLIIRVFYENDLDLQYAFMTVFAILLFIIVIIINKIYIKMKGLSTSYESAYILNTAFMNAGNFGSPIILLAFGPTGFSYAISFFVIQQVFMNTAGLYYAAKGKLAVKDAFIKIFQVPVFYAVILIMTIKGLSLKIPDNLFVIIDLLASAAIPTVMIILGMQLAMIQMKEFEWGSITYTTVVKLAVVPLIAYLLTFLFPFDPLLTKVLILQAAMPSAVVTTMLAVQFDSRPELVSSSTFINTLISIGTITILLIILS